MNLPRLVLADDHTDTRNQLACLLEQEFDVIACVRDERDADRAASGPDAVVSNVEKACSAAHPSHADSRARPF